jgi:hypothetical protein
MRDIRGDLRERIEIIDEEIRSLTARLEWLQSKRVALLELYGEEERRFVDSAPSDSRGSENELLRFIVQLVSGGGYWTVDRIREAAESQGVPIRSDHPGRSIHMMMVNLKRGGVVDQDSDGNWYATEPLRSGQQHELIRH